MREAWEDADKAGQPDPAVLSIAMTWWAGVGSHQLWDPPSSAQRPDSHGALSHRLYAALAVKLDVNGKWILCVPSGFMPDG